MNLYWFEEEKRVYLFDIKATNILNKDLVTVDGN